MPDMPHKLKLSELARFNVLPSDAMFVFRANGKKLLWFRSRPFNPDSKAKDNEMEAFTIAWLLSKPILFATVASMCKQELLAFEATAKKKRKDKEKRR